MYLRHILPPCRRPGTGDIEPPPPPPSVHLSVNLSVTFNLKAWGTTQVILLDLSNTCVYMPKCWFFQLLRQGTDWFLMSWNAKIILLTCNVLILRGINLSSQCPDHHPMWVNEARWRAGSSELTTLEPCICICSKSN